MRGITKFSVLSLSVVVLSGCWLDDDDNDPVTATPAPEPEVQSTYVRVHHTSADAPNVNVLADGTAVLDNVPYHASSTVLELDEGNYAITVEGILPDGSTVDVIGPADLEFAGDTRYEVFAVGQVADESLEPLILANPVTAVADGESRIQVVHAAYGAPTVDVYLTAPDEALADASPAATLEYAADTGQVEVPAGDYRVRLTPAGETTVVYDSGTVPLADGGDYIVAATNNVSMGDSPSSPVTLQISTGEQTLIVPDANAGSDIRVVHASPDAPNVDVTLNNAAEPQIADLAFGDFAGYLNVPEGEYVVDVAAAGGSPMVFDDVPLTLEAATSYSVYAVGEVANINLQVLTEARRPIATAAQLQIVHASPAAGNVDVYLTATDDISDAEPALTDVPFNAEALVSSGNIQVAPGEYFATVTATGTKDAAIGPVALTLDALGIYTIVATDSDGGGLPPQVILLDDLAPAQP